MDMISHNVWMDIDILLDINIKILKCIPYINVW
jgi:hypothetical protein